MEHDKARVPIIDSLSFEENFVDTDGAQAQPIVDAQSTPPRNDNIARMKNDPTIMDPVTIPEIPGGFLLQFTREKAEIPLQNEHMESEGVLKKEMGNWRPTDASKQRK